MNWGMVHTHRCNTTQPHKIQGRRLFNNMEGRQKHIKWKVVWLHVLETYTGRKRSTQASIPGVNTVTPAGRMNCYLHFPLSSLVYYHLFFFYNRHYLCNMRNKIKKFNQKQKHTIGGLGFCLDNLPTPRYMALPDTHLFSPGQTWQQPLVYGQEHHWEIKAIAQTPKPVIQVIIC